MTIFERVHELIKEQGLNVKQLERECGLANYSPLGNTNP